MPARPPCPKCDAGLPPVKLVALNEGGSRRDGCMRCDDVLQTRIVEKAMLAGGWVIAPGAGYGHHRARPIAMPQPPFVQSAHKPDEAFTPSPEFPIDVRPGTGVEIRAMSVAGRPVCVELECPFWECLDEIALGRRMMTSNLVSEIGHDADDIASAIRVYVLFHYQERDGLDASGSAAPDTSRKYH